MRPRDPESRARRRSIGEGGARLRRAGCKSMETQTFMRKRLLPLNPLRAFEATARYLSVSRAASELNVTPGAVSHQIRVLEDELKVLLFDRTPGQLRLTRHGLALQPSISAAFDSIAEASAFVSRQQTGGNLSVTCGQALASYWLLPRLGNFAKFYPGIRLKLMASGDDRDVALTDGDISICYGDGDWPQHHVRLWAHTTLTPVCNPTILNTRPLREPKDLAEHTILHSDEGGDWHRWFSAAKAPTITGARHFSLSNTHLAIEAAMNGHGVALCESLVVRHLIEEGRLMMPFSLTIPSSSAFYIVCPNELRNSGQVRAFADWLTTEVSEREQAAAPKPKPKRKTQRRPRKQP